MGSNSQPASGPTFTSDDEAAAAIDAANDAALAAAAEQPDAGTAEEPAAPVPDPEDIPGHVAVRHALGGSLGYEGINYEPDADGWIYVPADAVATLAALGFFPKVG